MNQPPTSSMAKILPEDPEYTAMLIQIMREEVNARRDRCRLLHARSESLRRMSRGARARSVAVRQRAWGRTGSHE